MGNNNKNTVWFALKRIVVLGKIILGIMLFFWGLNLVPGEMKTDKEIQYGRYLDFLMDSVGYYEGRVLEVEEFDKEKLEWKKNTDQATINKQSRIRPRLSRALKTLFKRILN